MKVPNEPGLSPNNGLEPVFQKDQSMANNSRKGQEKAAQVHTRSSSLCTSLSTGRVDFLQTLVFASFQVVTVSCMAFHLTLVVSFIACMCNH